MQRLTTALLDAHLLCRDALRAALEAEGSIEVVGVGASGQDAMRLIETARPRVALLDLDLPGRTPFDVAESCRSAGFATSIVILAPSPSDCHIDMAMDAGVAGYILKDEPLVKAMEAIKLIGQGQLYFSPAVEARLKRASGEERGSTPLTHLSRREKEVLIHLARGMSVKEVATELKLSRKTIDNHTQRLMAKLDIHSRADLVRYAIRERLIEA
ncbi:MAG: DNA-binding response regulator [Planctomyces sp.]|nr:DNA-binding response regulator [Planctomyces sp.]MBA4039141.1 DNA-binding response regulator [Planctomyces sp.]MBA4120055.1 DNA-binding response regulator [Isosphaera sp.]